MKKKNKVVQDQIIRSKVAFYEDDEKSSKIFLEFRKT